MPISNKLTLALLVLSVTTLLAQEPAGHDHAGMHAVNATPLHVTTKVAIAAEANRPVYRPARCDGEGNIYFRAYQPEERKVPVVRADAKGKTTRYTLDADPGFATATAYDFSVLPGGKLFQPVQVAKDVSIVAFDATGGIAWKTRLEKQFWVSRLIAFDDSKFLVIGTEPQSPDAPTAARVYRTVVAIFDRGGHLVRNVSLEREATESDSEKPDAPAGETQKPESPNRPGETQKPADESHNHSGETQKPPDEKHRSSPPLLAVLSADGQVDAEGKVYLMVHSEPPVVYAIDGAGDVLGSWEITPPAERMTAISMSIAKNQVAVLFRHSFQGMSHGEDIISVVDLSHGDANHRAHGGGAPSQFSVPPELSGSALGCFRRGEATFVGPDTASPAGPSLVIEHAKAK
jgi:hypothetical protein